MSDQGQGGGQPPQGSGFGQPQPGQPQQDGQGFGQAPQPPQQGGGFGQPPQTPPPGGGFGQPQGAPAIAVDPQTIDAGKTWSFLSYASFFVGFPLWIIPLAQKDNAYSLYHAKQAGGAYIIGAVLGLVVGMITLITCGFGAVLFPVVLLPVISAIHGLILVNNGEAREPVMVFGLGDKIFGSIQPKPPQY